MKRLFVFLPAVLAGLALLTLLPLRFRPAMPRPAGSFDPDNESDRNEKRNEWIQRMHRAAPGTDPQKIEIENRYRRYESFRGIRGARKTTAADTLAGGLLVGDWTERGSANQAGRIHLAEIDTLHNVLYAASAGGNIWKGSLSGSGWQPLNDLLQFDNVTAIRLVPHNGGQRLIACASGSRVHYTDDDGLNWNLAAGISNIASWGYIKRMVQVNDSAKTLYLLAKEWDYVNWEATTSIYRSADHGTNFTQLVSYRESQFPEAWHYDIWTPRYGNPDVYFLREDSVFVLDPTTGMPQGRGKISLINPGGAFLSGWDSTGLTWLYAYEDNELYRSTNAGQNWTHVSSPGFGAFSQNSFAVSFTNKNRICIGDIECHYSDDGGLSWQKVNDWPDYYGNPAAKLHADIPGILPVKDASGNEKVFVGTDGGLYVSNDQLQTVQNLSLSGLRVSQYYSVYTSRNQPHKVYAGAQDQGWQRATADPPSGLLGFSQVISGDYGQFVSSDGGVSLWMNYPGFTTYYPNAGTSNASIDWQFSNAASMPLWIPPLMADPAEPRIAYLVGGDLGAGGSRIIKLDATSGNIVATEGAYDFKNASGGSVLTALNYHAAANSHWFALTENGKCFRSSNSGQTWNLVSGFSGPGNHYFYGSVIASDPLDANGVYLGGSGYSNPAFFRSDNGGQSFYEDTLGLGKTLILGLAVSHDGRFVFAATESGPFVYVKDTHRWFMMANAKAPDQTYWSVDCFYDGLMHKTFVRFGTYGRGIWDFAYADSLPAVRTPESESMSLEVFPNPAGDWLQFKAPEGFDRIRVFDLKGGLQNEVEVSAGQILDISALPAGIYFLEASGRAGRKVRKFVHY